MSLDPDLKTAVQYLQDHAHGMRAVLAVADAVKDVAALEQLAQEATNRKDVAEAAVTRAQKHLANVRADVDKATELVEEKSLAVKELVDKARADATAIIGEAKVEAAKIIADATAKLNGEIADLTQRRNDMSDNLDETIAILDATVARQAEAETATKELESRASKAKAYLEKLTKE